MVVVWWLTGRGGGCDGEEAGGCGDALMVEVVLVVTSGGQTDLKSGDLGMMLVICRSRQSGGADGCVGCCGSVAAMMVKIW